jgi:VWFA-related protein
MSRLAPIATLLLFWPAAGVAQDPVIRIDVNLVQVDAVVTDSANKHVGNLKAEDFEVLQDGKPQTITNFSYIASGIAPPVITPSPSNGRNPLPPPRPLPTAGSVRRMFALVVDDLGLSFESIAHVRDALRKFVNREMQPGDLVAIVRTSAGMGALQQFTADPRILNAAIDHVKFTFGRVAESSFAPAIAPSSDFPQAKLDAANQSVDEFRSGILMAGTFGALRYVIDGLHDMPGRKSVVLFSESMALPETSLRGLTDAANRASVVIHTIDPRGLQTFYDVRDTDPNPTVQVQREAQMFESQQGLAGLAEATGGRFIKDNNRVDEALHEVVEDSDGYYLIGYRPDSATFDSKGEQPPYHRVQVRLRVAGLRVRSRAGFFGDPDTARDAPLQGSAALLHALTSPFASGDIHVQLTTLFNQTSGRRSNLSALLHIDAGDVKFDIQPDGSRKANLEVVAMTFGADGKAAGRTDRIFNLDLDPSQYAAALSKGMVYVMNQPVPAPGAYQMRVALRDQGSQRIGAANEFIEVPDLTDRRLALSSLLLRLDTRQSLSGPNLVEGKASDNDPATTAAFRVFQPGDPLYYEYFVFNAQTGASHNADLEVQTRLFRDGTLVYAGQPMVPAVAGEASAGRLLAGGHLTLAQEFPPGDYVLQVIVTDKVAKQKYRTATQAIDFAVAPR